MSTILAVWRELGVRGEVWCEGDRVELVCGAVGRGHVISGADGYALDVLFRCSAWYVPRLVLLDGKELVLWKSLILIC
mgnify:CR=1 FL=1